MDVSLAVPTALAALAYDVLSSKIDDSSVLTKNAALLGRDTMGTWLKSEFEHIKLKRKTLKSLMETMCVIDVCGILWVEYVALKSDEARLGRVFGNKDPHLRFDPAWFVDTIVDSQRSNWHNGVIRLAEETVALDSTSDARKVVQTALADAIKDELGWDEEDEYGPSRDYIGEYTEAAVMYIMEQLPGRWMAIPSVAEKIVLDNVLSTSEQVRGIASALSLGKNLADQALAYTAKLIEDHESEDVFRRNHPNAGLSLLPLSTVYVEPRVSIAGHRDTRPILTVLMEHVNSTSKGDALIVSANFGFGKSLTCRKLSIELAKVWENENCPFPVLLQCPDIMTDRTPSLPLSVRRHLQASLDVSEATAQEIYETWPIVVILDSFDEIAMPPRQTASYFREARSLSKQKNLTVIMTSRPTGYSHRWVRNNDVVVEVQEFSDGEIAEWLKRAAGILSIEITVEELKKRVPSDIIRIPILLLLSVWSGAAMEDHSATKAQIYELFVSKISQGKWTDFQDVHYGVEKGVGAVGGHKRFVEALSVIAWLAQRNRDSNTVSRKEATTRLRNRFGVGEAEVDELCDSIVLALFTSPSRGASDEIAFSHKSFREYLCAKYIVGSIGRPHAHGERGAFWLAMTENRIEMVHAEFLSEMISDDLRPGIIDVCTGVLEDRKVVFRHESNLSSHTKALPGHEFFQTSWRLDVTRTLRGNAALMMFICHSRGTLPSLAVMRTIQGIRHFGATRSGLPFMRPGRSLVITGRHRVGGRSMVSQAYRLESCETVLIMETDHLREGAVAAYLSRMAGINSHLFVGFHLEGSTLTSDAFSSLRVGGYPGEMIASVGGLIASVDRVSILCSSLDSLGVPFTPESLVEVGLGGGSASLRYILEVESLGKGPRSNIDALLGWANRCVQLQGLMKGRRELVALLDDAAGKAGGGYEDVLPSLKKAFSLYGELVESKKMYDDIPF